MLTYYHKLNIRRPVKMEEEPITFIKLIDEDQSVVPTTTPTGDSPVFRYFLLEKMNQDEEKINDFNPKSVYMFIYLLENRHLDEIEGSSISLNFRSGDNCVK